MLLHGSNESARSHTGLAVALADAFTLYLPDRRGRGMSGPYGPDYGMRTEVEDLDAVLAESGAQLVFGVSAGGLVVLEAARTRPAIRKVAVYEPALLMDRTNMAMKNEDKKAASDAVTMRKLAPTVRNEGVLLAEMAGTIDTFRAVPADVLLLGGSKKGPAFLRPALDASP